MEPTRLISLGVVMVLGLACKGDTGEAGDPVAEPGAEAEANDRRTPVADEAWAKAKARQDALAKELRQELDQLEGKLARWEAEAEGQGKEARDELRAARDQARDDLRVARDQARAKLQQLENQGSEAWDETKAEVREALASLRGKLEQAERQLE